jgi:taurine transport system ATP-binding protein
VLEIERLSVEFRPKHGVPLLALHDINLTVRPGEFVVALGASGCGKTTLLNTVAGFLPPSAGQLRLNGGTIAGPGKERGMVFQKHALMPWLNVQANVEFGLRLHGVARAARRSIALECLRRVGLEHAAQQPVYELSGGMQQRVGVARALATAPAVLLLDEPLGALDAFTRESIQQILLDVWRGDPARIFLFITHDVEEALFLATRLLIMAPRPGRIVREFDVPFSRQYAQRRAAQCGTAEALQARTGEGGASAAYDPALARAIKASAAFIAMREQVLALMHDRTLGVLP